MTMTAAERKRADAYAGPDKSFPLYSSGAHLKAAWNLAGHAANPAAVRAKILAFARKHGLTNRLPSTAKAQPAGGDGNFTEVPILALPAGPERMQPQGALSPGVQGHITWYETTSAPQPQGSLGENVEQSLPSEAPSDQPEGADGGVEEGTEDAGDTGPEEGSYLTQEPGALPGVSAGSVPPAASGDSFAGTYNSAGFSNTGRAPAQGRVYTTDPTGDRLQSHQLSAKASRVRQAVQMAYDHAERADGGPEGYGMARDQVVDFAHEHDLLQHLPERAHGYMHRVGRQHKHPGITDPDHVHVIKKAFNVVGKSATIEKAWSGPDGTCIIEGWVSTADPDQEKDVVEPEAFEASLDGYAQRRMPLSSEHQTKALPIGHGQALALVRDGQVLKSAYHPSDRAEFEHFPRYGTGVYGRFVITDPKHADQVRKGNIGGFSWIGNLTEYEPLASGGRRFLRVDPWLESTVAAYPINGKAVLLAAKAYESELAPQQEEFDVTVIDDLLQGALEAASREEAGPKVDLEAIVSSAVQKALSQSREGVGRGPVAQPAGSEKEDDPASYIVKKAIEAAEAGKELSQEDKQLAWGITEHYLGEGLK